MNAAIPILLYHSIAEDCAPQFKQWSVSPRLFAAHLAYLNEQRFRPITVTQLATAMTEGSVSLPNRSVVITFDDGFADFYDNALPLLMRYGFAATLYITTGFVGGTSRWLRREGEGGRPMLTWGQIAEISASGVECGTHTQSHPQLDTLSTSVAREEIAIPKSVLEHHLGKQVCTIAYPHGYYSPTIRRLVQQAGYSSACAVKNAMSAVTDDRFALARIIVANGTDVETLGGLLAGRRLRVAPVRERLTTKGWRLFRRSAVMFEQRSRVENGGN
jgi:peptidoglycan/xylan/chitin deacetylase (PgdA/CDA1 family)